MTCDTWCQFQRDSSHGTYQHPIFNVMLIQASKASCSNWFSAQTINGPQPTPITTNPFCWICSLVSLWSSTILSPSPNRCPEYFFSTKSETAWNSIIEFLIQLTITISFSLYINSKRKWARFDMRGKFLDQTEAPDINDEWEILCMIFIFLLEN